MPVWTSRKQRTAVGAAIIAAALGTLASAGVGPHRVAAEPAHPPANTQSSGVPSPGAPSYNLPVAGGGQPPTSRPILTPTGPGIPPNITDPPPAGPLAPQLASDGIPSIALDAYRKAAARLGVTQPGCGIPWPLLAAIGRVESDHGRFAGSQLYSDGTSAPRIIGIPLNGNGTALIRDTDHGVLDGDTVYDHAVGPMQFIPSTWATWGVDGNGDGVISPFNIYDAALAAADYLCAAGGDLRTSAGQVKAVLTYNDSAEYLSTVLGLEKVYAAGVPGVTIPVLPVNPQPPPNEKPVLPPADPGRPPGLPPLSTKPSAHSGSSSGTKAGSNPGSNPSSPGGSTPGSPGGSTTPTDTPPTVKLNVTSKTGAPHDITVDASGSTDDHGITGYSYDFGDGSKAVSGAANSAEYVYPKAGWFVITVTATDTAGHQGKATVRVLIDTPPKADATFTQADGSLDVTADPNVSTDVGGLGIVKYVIDFGDKTDPVTVDAGKTQAHTYPAAGDYTVTLTAVDAAGKSTTVTKPITVTAPSSTTTPSGTTSAGTGTGTGTGDSTAGGSTSANSSASSS